MHRMLLCLLVLWLIVLAVSFAHFRLLSTRIFAVMLAPFIELVRFSLLLEPSEEEPYVQAESVIEEEQEPAYFAEPIKPPSKNPLMSYLFYKACFVFKNKIMHVLFPYVTPCHPKTIFKNIEWTIVLSIVYNRLAILKSSLRSLSLKAPSKRLNIPFRIF